MRESEPESGAKDCHGDGKAGSGEIGADAGHEQGDADDTERKTHLHEGAGRDACRQARSHKRQNEQRERHGEDAQARSQRVKPEHGLQVQRQDEEGARDDEVHDHG